MKRILFIVGVTLLLFSCNRQVKKDAERMAELFCKQSKIMQEAKNLNDPTTKQQLADIEKEVDVIKKQLQTKYSKDIDAMETFAKTYQEGITSCK